MMPSNRQALELEVITSRDCKDLENIAFYQQAQSDSSCMYQETEKSLRVNFSAGHTDVQFLHQLLHELAEHRENYRNLSNLLFHGVEWQTEGLRLLCSFMCVGSNVKQVEFQRSIFTTQGLFEVSQMLETNSTIKAIIFSECDIGAAGATLLASALAKNNSVEELQVWDDSIGSKGAEELSKTIEVNNAMKLLIILDNHAITAVPLISAVLARNRTMEVHVWGRGRGRDGGGESSKIAELLPETETLRIYEIDTMGSQRVACALAWNTTVTTLDMTGVRLKSNWAREFRGVLERNRSLRDVKLSRSCLRDKAVVYIAAGLFKNNCLEKLRLDGNCFSGVGVEHLLCPLSTFSPLQSQANTMLNSLSLGGERTKIGRHGVMAILRMLETNRSIVQFAICDDTSLRPDDIVKLFKSLEKNATLRCLSLKGCKGVEGELVLRTIMETLQVNPWIEEIDLGETPLQVAGKTDQIYEKLGQNGTLLPAMLGDLPMAMPTCCRVFFCGQEFAGKATLCNSIYHNMTSMKLPYMDQLRTLVNPAEQIARTHEIKTTTIHDGDAKLTIWNIGGHHENFALRDLVFPGHGGPVLFVIISSLFRKPANKDPKSLEEIEEDLLYWLQFVASNSRRKAPQTVLPHVTMVLTHSDKVPHLSGGLDPIAILMRRLREEFHKYVDFYPTVFAVDARSSVSVSKLTHHLRKTSKTILQQAPQVYRVCNDLTNILRDWSSKNSNKPVIRWTEFCEMCQLKVPALRIRSRRDNMEKVDTRRRAAANSLHSLGEVIFFEELGFLIINCEWFYRDILGRVLTLNVAKVDGAGKNGFICKKDLERILRERLWKQMSRISCSSYACFEANDLINMMLKLELCYEQEPGNPNTLILVPALLEESRLAAQRWQLSTLECAYAARRLECGDRHTSLTTDFFPQLQVHLHNKIMQTTKQQCALYNLEKYLIYTVINGIHVRVELGVKLGCYIDVLACSTKSVTDMIRLFHQLIIPTILNMCPNTIFKESIIRPDCVKNLTPHRFRRSQLVLLEKLKEILLSVPADSMYNYQHTWSSVENNKGLVLKSASDYARDLLSDEDFREVLHRRYYDLHHLAVELAVEPEEHQGAEIVDIDESAPQAAIEPSISGITKGVELVLQRLRRIEQQIKDLREEIQGLRYYEHHLLTQLHRKVDYIVNYNIQLEERKVPHMFYFVNVDNYSKRLVTRVLPGMRALRLHMLCEFRREMHVVDDQVGCELIQVDNQMVRCLLPYMNKFMKLLTFALKIGAHFAVGMGEMIPDLSREVVHLRDSSLIYGATSISLGALGAAIFGKVGGSKTRNNTNDMAGDMKAARQWLVDFLKSQGITDGMHIAERFGLWRVRYRDDGCIAWICRKHITTREDQVFELAV